MAKSIYVEEIQQSLNDQYMDHPNYPLAVDGLIGPKTCGALYKLQKEWLYDDSSTISFDTIKTLDTGFTANHLTAVQNKCKPYFKGGGEATGPVIDNGSGTIDSGGETGAVIEKKSVLPYILLGGAIGGVGAYVGHRKGWIKMGNTPAITGVGAAAGALTMWFLSKPKTA